LISNTAQFLIKQESRPDASLHPEHFTTVAMSAGESAQDKIFLLNEDGLTALLEPQHETLEQGRVEYLIPTEDNIRILLKPSFAKMHYMAVPTNQSSCQTPVPAARAISKSTSKPMKKRPRTITANSRPSFEAVLLPAEGDFAASAALLEIERLQKEKNDIEKAMPRRKPDPDLYSDIEKWRSAAQELAEAVFEIAQNQSEVKMTMPKMLQHLQVDPALLHYDADEESFR